MHFVQLIHPEHGRRTAAVDGSELQLLASHHTLYDLATEAIARGVGLDTLGHSDCGSEHLPYDEIYSGRSAWRILPPFDHPAEPARCLVSGTGLTHKASAENRAKPWLALSCDLMGGTTRVYTSNYREGSRQDPLQDPLMDKQSNTGILGLLSSWKRELGISGARRLSHKLGRPVTGPSWKRKNGRAVRWCVVLALPATCAVLGCAISLFSQTAAEPVPAKWLHDGKLVAEDFSFSIDSPNPDSRWTYIRLPELQGRKETAFVVEPSKDTRFLIVAWDKSGSIGPGSTNSFVDGMRRSMPKDWRVDDVKIEPTAFPLRNSSKLTVTIRRPDEPTLYAYGYVVSSNRTYMLLNYSSETVEPPQFNHFVGSFALLPPPKSKSDLVFYSFFACTLLVCQVIPIWISAKAKPLADKPYRWGTYVGICTGLLGVMLLPLAYSGVDAYGKACGAGVSLCAILCSIGILRRRKFGVVMFIVTCVLFMMANPFLDAMRNLPATPQQQGEAFPSLVLLATTTTYFAKRWRLMGHLNPPIPAPLLPSDVV